MIEHVRKQSRMWIHLVSFLENSSWRATAWIKTRISRNVECPEILIQWMKINDSSPKREFMLGS